MIVWLRGHWRSVGLAALIPLVAVLAHGLGFAGASGYTLSSPPGMVQATGDTTVISTVSDPFKGGSADLGGQSSDFDGGGGSVTGGGPAWVSLTGGTSSTDWQVVRSGGSRWVTRATGASQAAALVSYLTRQSTVSVELTSITTSTNAGVIMGANSGATRGVVAVLYHDGSNYRFGFYRLTSATAWGSCGTHATISGTPSSPSTISVTYTPATGAQATATITGLASPIDSGNCALGQANGDLVGMFSRTASSTRYDNFNAAL